MRVLICYVATLSAVLILGAPSSVAQSTFPLVDAVGYFQSIWSVDVSYASSTVHGRSTSWNGPVAADAESDLAYLLEGTGVTFSRQPSGTFFLVPLETQIAILTGKVRSIEDSTPLRGAHIALVGTEEGTVSDLFGEFVLVSQARNPARIRISHVGFLPQERELELYADSTLTVDFWLSEWIIQERPMEITAPALTSDQPFMVSDRPFEMDTREQADLREITGMGTSDAVRSLRDVAGLYIDLNSSDIHVQGGGLGEHQFKLDGSAIFEPIHLGLFGIFNPFAIDQITIRKAGFDVEHGSFLAGVINAEHSLDSDRAVEVQIDPISFNARINSQMNLDETTLSLMGAYRTSIWDHWWSNLRSESVDDLLRDWNRPDEFLMRASIYPLKRVSEQGYNTLLSRLQKIPYPTLPEISFNDLHAAVKLDFQNGKEFGSSIYKGNSNLTGRLFSASTELDDKTVPPDRHEWENQSTRFYWQQNFTDRFGWYFSWRRSKYSLSHNYGGLDRQNSVHAAFNLYRYNSVETSDENGISNDDLNLSLHHTHNLGVFKAGLDLSWIHHHFSIQHVFPRVIDHERRSFISSGFIKQQWTPFPWIELSTGLRLTWLRVRDEWHLEPRTSLLLKSPYRGGYGISLRLSTGVYHQFLNQFEIATISPSTIVPSTRFWLPVDETHRAPMAYHYSIDLSAQLWTNWQFGFEYYYKDQQRLYRIDYPELWSQEVDSSAINRIDLFTTKTDGLAFGSSVELRRNGEKIHFALRYELSESKRDYTFRNNESVTLPVPWNVPRQLQLRTIIKPIPALEATIRWYGTWGRKWAYKQAYYDLLGSNINYAAKFDDYSFEDPTAKGHTLRPFTQVDLEIAAIIRDQSNHNLQIRLNVLNAFDRMNPAYRYLRERQQFGSDQKILREETGYLISRTFSISAQLQW